MPDILVVGIVRDFRIVTGGGFVPAYKDDGYDALAINPGQYKDKFAAKVLLGYASTSTTEIYLLEEVQEAIKVAKLLSSSV